MATKPLNEKLLLLLKLKDFTQTEVAKECDMQLSHINRYFNGASDITTAPFLEILKCLGIDLNQIVSDEIQKITGNGAPEVSDFNSSIGYLIDSLDELGRQTALKNLLWMADMSLQAKGKSLPKQLANKIKKELSLI